MRKIPRVAIVGFLAVAYAGWAGGCAPFPPPKKAISDSRLYKERYRDVWYAVLDTLSDRNIRVTSARQMSGTIAAEDDSIALRRFDIGRYDSRYCLCGAPGRGHAFRQLVGTYAFALVRAGADEVSVKVDATYRASVYAGDRFVDWVSCPSKGTFEPAFLKEVAFRLASGNQPEKPPRSGEEGPVFPRPNLDSWWK